MTMPPEEWRPALAPNYEVSSHGRVRRAAIGCRTAPGKVLRPARGKVGYLRVAPVVNGRNKTFAVHDLVAHAFLGTRPTGGHINHKDGDKHNNMVENIEYVTPTENSEHAWSLGLLCVGEQHYAAKLTEESVRALRRDRAGGMSFSKLSAKYGVSIATAHAAATGKGWRHVA